MGRHMKVSLRSIPAHAGEPLDEAVAAGAGKVYPRPRGGTLHVHRENGDGRGLSPPTRGNRREFAFLVFVRGSIPAHAGEPAP